MILNTRELFKTMYLGELQDLAKELEGEIFNRKINKLKEEISLEYYLNYSDQKGFESGVSIAKGMKELPCIKCHEAKLTINNEKDMLYCFGCHFAGDIYSYIALEKNTTFHQAYEYLQSLLDSGTLKKYGEITKLA